MTDPRSKPHIKLCRIKRKLKEDANLFSPASHDSTYQAKPVQPAMPSRRSAHRLPLGFPSSEFRCVFPRDLSEDCAAGER
jgi:hypothetical protein